MSLHHIHFCSIDVQRCSQTFKDAPRCSIDVQRCSKMLDFDALPWLLDLCERRNTVKVSRNIPVVNRTVMLRHLKRGVSQQFLKGKGVSTAIHQVFSGEGMPKGVDTCLLDAPPIVETVYPFPQGFFCQLFAKLITEQIIGRGAFADK